MKLNKATRNSRHEPRYLNLSKSRLKPILIVQLMKFAKYMAVNKTVLILTIIARWIIHLITLLFYRIIDSIK